jgi:flavin reductase (DIM6/NTAB) family NADH-FMN oxidoreductase RutF
MSRFATGVCIATSRDASGNPVGMTINSFNSVSLDPPLILWTVGRQASEYEAFCAASGYVIHLLRESESELSTHFAIPSDDKFTGQDFDLSGALPRMNNPWLMLECRAEHSFAAADHNILVGRVVTIENNATDGSALLYYASQYHQLGTSIN